MKLKGQELTPRQLRVHDRLQEDLRFYCKKVLKIETKDGRLVPFVWNRAQEYIHERLEAQLEETGMVRALILKGRQQGCSTYVTGRYAQKAAWQHHKSVYILSHEGSSTATLLGKVQTYLDNMPEVVKPGIDIGNRNEFKFDNGSKYRVGTAGAKNTGRSQTNQYFHGSEVAYYDNTEGISSGVLQTVANVPGTEIILESTANGVGDFFHKSCMEAMAGEGDYQLIFVPWHWQEEYSRPVPRGFEFSLKEREIQETYDLTDEQLYWRHLKVIELKSERLFKQEYPFTVNEAFQASGATLLDPDDVQRARRSNLKDPDRPIIIGVDPARNRDRTVIAVRRGREILEIIKYDDMDNTRLTGILSRLIERRDAAKCFIDVGMGYGVIDNLHANGYKNIVTGVHFGARADNSEVYINKRVEMAGNFQEWLSEGDVSIPDDEEMEVDLMSIPAFRRNGNGIFTLEAKEKIKERLGKSPDVFDAIILTFAYPVHDQAKSNRLQRKTVNTRKGSSLTTLRRQRGEKSWDESSGDYEWEDDRSPMYNQYNRTRRKRGVV